MDRDYEANKLISMADKKLKPGFFEKWFSSKESRLEEALDLYEKAATMFKLQKKWFEAGECYEKCSSIEEQLNSDNAAGHYHDASHCFNYVDKPRASENLNKCLKVYEMLGRFQMAGKTQKQMAEEYESETNYDQAIVAYKRAAEYFSMENLNSKSYEQGCLLKQADLMCISDHKDSLEECVKIYEKLGMQYLTVSLLKPGAKDLFFKCVVVLIAHDDHISAENYLNKFISEDPSFDNIRESTFLKEAIEAYKEKNAVGFRTAVTKLKNYSDIDKWRIKMFSKILENIEKEDVSPFL